MSTTRYVGRAKVPTQAWSTEDTMVLPAVVPTQPAEPKRHRTRQGPALERIRAGHKCPVRRRNKSLGVVFDLGKKIGTELERRRWEERFNDEIEAAVCEALELIAADQATETFALVAADIEGADITHQIGAYLAGLTGDRGYWPPEGDRELLYRLYLAGLRDAEPSEGGGGDD